MKTTRSPRPGRSGRAGRQGRHGTGPEAKAARSRGGRRRRTSWCQSSRVRFGDTKNYFDFLAHGEVQMTRTRIGAGPGGKTLVYGITKADVKASSPSRGERLMEGTLAEDAPFYGEVFKNGRFYLFGDLKDMKDFTAFGEVPYSYTDVGAGPKGETLVFVMNKASYKKGKPVERKDRFVALRAARG